MNISMKTVLRVCGGLVLALLLGGGLVALPVLQAVAPRPGEWSTTLRLGPLQRAASVPTLLRWASHPLVRPQLDGRSVATDAGRWSFATRDGGAIEASCAPCRVQLDALGSAPIALDRVVLHVQPLGADRYEGRLTLGTGAAPLVLPWRAELTADALQLRGELARTPLAVALAPLAGEVPELTRARVDGTLALKLEARVDAAGLHFTRLQPRLADVAVTGLGTEALLDADPGQRCRPQPAGGRIEGWIQNAVIAAEDARYAEHAGYELDAWLKVWKHNQRSPDVLQGASTITQQLAKLLYTGDERSAARKLREWLYAVEMEDTLGKGRILQLYLAVLPWGDGICGAEAAARHHLGKPASQLKPREAAWLASLLINPDVQLRSWAHEDAAARARAAAVLKGIKRLPRERREAELDALVSWRPPVGRAPR